MVEIFFMVLDFGLFVSKYMERNGKYLPWLSAL
jgi:hypothetical protein